MIRKFLCKLGWHSWMYELIFEKDEEVPRLIFECAFCGKMKGDINEMGN